MTFKLQCSFSKVASLQTFARIFSEIFSTMEFAAYEKLLQSKMNFLKQKKNSDFFNSLKIKICFQALYEVVAFVSLVTTFTMKMTLHLLKKSYFHLFMDKKSHEIQKQPPRVFCKKSVLRNFVNFTGKTPALESLLNKGLQLLLKRDSNTGVFL